MDLDTIITFVIFVLFFILPAVFKMLVSKKTGSNPTVLGKIGEKVQKFIQELEEQRQQEPMENQNAWEMIINESEQPIDEPFIEQPLENRPVPPKFSSEKTVVQKEFVAPVKVKGSVKTRCGKSGRIKLHPLQNAVVWSEILASPLALRDK